MKYHWPFTLTLLILLTNCAGKKESEPLSLIWNENKATGVSFSTERTGEIPLDSLESLLQIKLTTATEDRPILGTFAIEDNRIAFTPLVPFTRGFKYEVHFRGRVIEEFEILFANNEQSPRLLSVYPTQDTVPENLLKLYLHFSVPMAEGRSLKFVTVLRNNRDTVKGTFLDLQPELWDEDGTVLTLWLDPGRIKRDLIPNKELGNPLVKGSQYSINIAAGWKSKSGLKLETGYSKSFYVGARDEHVPDITKWKVVVPRGATKEKLTITFGESIDYALINSAIQVVNDRDELVEGIIESDQEEKVAYFIPAENWKTGEYTLRGEPRLEDLAGNNLIRLFDRDVSVPETERNETLFLIKFTIR
jgi:hypothetical protein